MGDVHQVLLGPCALRRHQSLLDGGGGGGGRRHSSLSSALLRRRVHRYGGTLLRDGTSSTASQRIW